MSGREEMETEILGTKKPLFFSEQPQPLTHAKSSKSKVSVSDFSESTLPSRWSSTETPCPSTSVLPPVFLRSCFLCKRSLVPGRDIYMYREQAFCSIECRAEQMRAYEQETKTQTRKNPCRTESEKANTTDFDMQNRAKKVEFDQLSSPFKAEDERNTPEVKFQKIPEATSQIPEPEVKQNPTMHAESQSFLNPTDILLESMATNGIVFMSRGRSHDCSLNAVMESVGNSDLGKIGIHGREGVGKTTFVGALKDQPMMRSLFDCVISVPIPKVYNLEELQQKILRQLASIEVDQDEHANLQSQKLFNLLEQRKFLLILDEVDEFIDLKTVGIPEPTPKNGSKIILTTRMEQVCDAMLVDWKIRLEDLLSWELFCQNVGEIVGSSSIQPLAKKLVEMCCNYSHPIVLMARALKDASDLRIWSSVFETLSKEPACHEEKLETLMVKVLKFCYKRLPDDMTRKCLKNFALLCEKQPTEIELLIYRWIEDGLVAAYHQGKEIINTLLNAHLLNSSSGRFIELEEIDQHLMIDHIFLPEERRLILMGGGMRLKETPNVEEWESSKEIYLMDNELSTLPENPSCLILEALFLQRNSKLRKIPPLFFSHMPALKILNLSRTRIKSLPGILFKLVSLKRLYLNHCDLLMQLSPDIGELKHLEVLDLEGTEIMDLPKNVEQLTELKSLEVSFCEPMNHRISEQSNTVIPYRIISALFQLEELNIEASPDDERWKACVEDVSEICSLKMLNKLKFYFPRAEFLSYFKWDGIDMHHPKLSHFRFTVGHRVKRIISRLPNEVEFELEQHDRCLKFVNGTEISGDIKKVLRQATAFLLDRHMTVRKLSEFGYENISQLKCCVVGECNELQAIIDGSQVDTRLGDLSLEYLHVYYVKNLISIWEGNLQCSGLYFLKSLTLRMCPKLTTIFTSSFVGTLTCLEELTVDDCPAIITLVNCNNSQDQYIVPSLKRICLHYLPGLVDFSDLTLILPRLEWMSIRYCPRLKRLPVYNKAMNRRLRKIMGERSWWRSLRWEGTQDSWDDVFVPIDLCD